MNKITFNHDADKLAEALDMSESQVQELSEKVSAMCTNLASKHHKQSKLAEEIAHQLSYKELLFLTTVSLVEKTEQWISENPLSIIKGIIRQVKEEKSNEDEQDN
jgi:hypothetical protein